MRFPVLALALAALCATASANGRPPVTNGVFFKPGDNQSLYIRTTFGLLISHDDGCSFHWVCEKAIGYGGEFDPKYAITADGTIFATTFTGLRVSRDQGCTWTTATSELPTNDPNNLATTWIDAIDVAPNGNIWIATADSAKPNDVYRSTDNGVSFSPMGLMSPTLWWKSIKIAPSDGMRIYATGYQVAPTGLAKVERSDTGGTSWTDKTLPANVMYGPTPLFYVSTVDPAQPDHLFGYSIGATPPNGDRLYESTDGATTWNEVLSTTDAIRGVVLRTDGSVIVATLGGGTSQRAAGASSFSLLGSTVTDGPDAVPPHLGCLGERPDGSLVGCASNW
ncbi:MAG TPA: sialidase family protein, partial [Kofleriaceae bacterium]